MHPLEITSAIDHPDGAQVTLVQIPYGGYQLIVSLGGLERVRMISEDLARHYRDRTSLAAEGIITQMKTEILDELRRKASGAAVA